MCPPKKGQFHRSHREPRSLASSNLEPSWPTHFLAYSLGSSSVFTDPEKYHFVSIVSMLLEEKNEFLLVSATPRLLTLCHSLYLLLALRSFGSKVTLLNPFLEIMFQEPQSQWPSSQQGTISQWKYIINLFTYFIIIPTNWK